MLIKDWRHRLKGSFEIKSIAYWHRIFWVFIVRSSPFLFVHPLYFESINEKSFGLNNPLLSFAILISLQMHYAFCFVTWLDYLHCISDFSLFMQNLLTTRELWSLEHKDEKLVVSCVKAWTIMVFVSKNEKWDTMWWASIEIEISSRAEEKETTPIGPQSVHGWEAGELIKEKTIKVNLMHKHFIHAKSYIA